MINHHIETNHKDQLKLPIPTSLDAINKILSNFTKNKKVLVPLQRIVDIMGDYWFNPEIRKIGYMLVCIYIKYKIIQFLSILKLYKADLFILCFKVCVILARLQHMVGHGS